MEGPVETSLGTGPRVPGEGLGRRGVEFLLGAGTDPLTLVPPLTPGVCLGMVPGDSETGADPSPPLECHQGPGSWFGWTPKVALSPPSPPSGVRVRDGVGGAGPRRQGREGRGVGVRGPRRQRRPRGLGPGERPPDSFGLCPVPHPLPSPPTTPLGTWGVPSTMVPRSGSRGQPGRTPRARGCGSRGLRLCRGRSSRPFTPPPLPAGPGPALQARRRPSPTAPSSRARRPPRGGRGGGGRRAGAPRGEGRVGGGHGGRGRRVGAPASRRTAAPPSPAAPPHISPAAAGAKGGTTNEPRARSPAALASEEPWSTRGGPGAWDLRRAGRPPLGLRTLPPPPPRQGAQGPFPLRSGSLPPPEPPKPRGGAPRPRRGRGHRGAETQAGSPRAEPRWRGAGGDPASAGPAPPPQGQTRARATTLGARALLGPWRAGRSGAQTLAKPRPRPGAPSAGPTDPGGPRVPERGPACLPRRPAPLLPESHGLPP